MQCQIKKRYIGVYRLGLNIETCTNNSVGYTFSGQEHPLEVIHEKLDWLRQYRDHLAQWQELIDVVLAAA
ncbi:hypothetical protein [Desulfosarcina sp.]|uniref:hypothetical protein n=1 Tax=Desulfosarcina sp. TaxID=2027861 RepID=UPI003970C0DE